MNREIKIGDNILFLWNGWRSDEEESIFDGTVISINKNQVTVSILHGYKSSSEDVKMDKVVAIDSTYIPEMGLSLTSERNGLWNETLYSFML